MTCGNFFLLRGLSFSWCLELIQRYRHHESKSVRLIIFFSSVFLLCKLYLWIFCELILLKKPPHLLQRVSALTTSKQNALKVHPLQAFTLSGIHQRVSKPTENSFSPSELPMLRSPASLCTASALPRGNTTRRAELSPHQVNRLIFIKDAVARPLLAQEL